jgi:hypothetical protein
LCRLDINNLQKHVSLCRKYVTSLKSELFSERLDVLFQTLEDVENLVTFFEIGCVLQLVSIVFL